MLQILAALGGLLVSLPALAVPDVGDTVPSLRQSTNSVWIVVTGSLVFFMQAGFALLESGMSRSKNATNVIMKNYCDMCYGGLIYWLVGYGIMFGSNPTGWFGTDHFFLTHTEPLDYTWMFFQMMFAATSATIVSGALAERTRFWGYLVGSVVITGFIYAVFGSWAWGSLYSGKGWLKELGFIDFAGSTVVHSIGGWCALAGVIIVRPRLGRYGPDGSIRTISGHNLTSVALGGFILWIGWFGFNGGSTLVANLDIGKIVLNTHLAGAAGACGAMLVMAIFRMPMLMTATVNGSIGGLVSVTAGCFLMEPGFAIVTGVVAGGITVLVPSLLDRMRLDDVVGAVAVHGCCGAWGTLAAGLFNAAALFDLVQVSVQLLGICVAFLWAFPTALLMYWLIDKWLGMRASTLDEQRGLDYTEHYELSYPEFQRDTLHQGKD
jgi:Amt family ammonium transporter